VAFEASEAFVASLKWAVIWSNAYSWSRTEYADGALDSSLTRSIVCDYPEFIHPFGDFFARVLIVHLFGGHRARRPQLSAVGRRFRAGLQDAEEQECETIAAQPGRE
jgi:hypothetical protein